MRSKLLLAALLLAPSMSMGDDAQPVFELERFYTAPQSRQVDPPLMVGDVIKFRWIGERKPPSSAVRIGAASGQKPLSEEGWEVYAHPKDDPASAFSMIPIRSGDIRLPELQVMDADGKVLGRTRSMAFKIASTPGTPGEQPADFVPPKRIPMPRAWLMGLSLLFVLLLAAGSYAYLRYLRRKKRSAAARSSKIQRPALPEDEEALQRLSALETQGWYLHGEFKRHYFGVSEALKQYIERRFGFDAAERTTREMLRGLESAGAPVDSIRDLSSLFELLDRVKFTDFDPGMESEEPVRVLESARAWVTRTRRVQEKLHAP